MDFRAGTVASIEEDRLRALRSYEILDSLPERAFDELTALAAQVCQTPIASLTLVDEERQWFKSIVGLPLRELPRSHAFSEHTVRGQALFVVPDAAQDPRFAASPLVTGEAGIRFYAGVPLTGHDGHIVGAIAVLDRRPRDLSEAEIGALESIGRQIMDQMDLRLQRIQMERVLAEKEQLEHQSARDRAHLCDAQRLAGVGSWRHSLADGLLVWTDEVFRIFGIAPRAIQPTYELFLTFVHPDDQEALRQARARTLEGGEPFDFEHRIVRPDGSIREVRERAEVVLNHGKVVAIAGTVHDVTEQRSAHNAVLQSERRFREIVQASPDLILVQQEDKITFINDAGLRLLRAEKPEQILGRSLLDFVHPSFKDAIRERTAWLLEEPRTAPVVEIKVVAVNGAIVDVSEHALSFVSKDGLSLQVRHRDMTERNRAEAAVRASEQRLRQILDALPMAAYTCDVEGRLTYFNEKAQEVWGRTPRLNSDAERYCGSFRLLRPNGSPLPHDACWMAATLERGRAHNGGEAIIVRPDGGHRHVTAHTNPFFDAEGKLSGAVNVLMDITERRQAQAALLESEERFRTVAKAATDAIWDWNIDTDTIWWSDGIQNLFGYAVAEVPTDCHTWTARIHPDDQKRVVEGIFAAVEGGGNHWEEEYHFQRSDGSYAYVLDRGFVIRDASGRAYRMIGGMTDLSDRRRIEKHLQDSEAKFRELAENIDAVFYNIDLTNDRLLYISPAYERIWRRSCQSAHAGVWSYLDGVHPRDSAAVNAARDRLLDGEETDIEYRVLTPEREIKWIRDHSYPIFNAHGRVERVVGTARDVTERKLADQRILEQAELLDKAHDAITVRNLEHRITYWNKSAERIYGWTAEEVMDRCVPEVLYRDDAQYWQAYRLLLENGEWSGELQQIHKAGNDITVEARWTLVRDDDEQPESVLAIHTDITERKQMEGQFLRAQRLESLGTLAGGIAHDLNNVLAPILMSIDLLKMSSREESEFGILSTIELSAKRGAEMVQQVLSFARGVEGRRLVIEPAAAVREIEHIVHEIFPKNIEFRAQAPANIPAFIGDPTQIHQVLINLCVNARDAMPDGGRIQVWTDMAKLDNSARTLHPNARAGLYVVFNVLDTGTGIPAEIKEKIFDPFFTTKELGKGTGLGLSTVLAIVKSHGGFIHVDSQPGKGSTFSVYLPAHTDRHAGMDARSEDAHPRGNGELVLVVDDEESVRLITRQTLEAYGYRVLAAGDGAEAIALYAQHGEEIDVVLTDMMMPIMDGPSAIQVLLRMNPRLRVIAVSGLSSTGSAALVAGMGVKHLLPKPYTAQTLLLALRELLNAAG